MLTGSRVRRKCVCEPSKREPLVIPDQLKGGGTDAELLQRILEFLDWKAICARIRRSYLCTRYGIQERMILDLLQRKMFFYAALTSKEWRCTGIGRT